MRDEMSRIKQLLSSKFSNNASWIIGAKVYQMAVNLVISMLTARFLGPANFGLINYAASYVALFTSLCTLGINNVIVNELINNRNLQGRLLGSSITMRLASSLLSLVTILALAWGLNPDEPLTRQVVLIYSTTLIFQCFDTLNYWYQSNLMSKVSSRIAIVGYTAGAIYKTVLLILGKDVRWFAFSHALECAFVAVLLVVFYSREMGGTQPLCWSRPHEKTLLRKSYHYILSGLMIAVYGQMDRIMLKEMLGETSVGYYSAAYTVCTAWPFVLAAIIDSARPIILEEYKAGSSMYETHIIRLYSAIVYISLAVGLVMTVFSKPVILLLYGREYLPAWGALCILCWFAAFSYLGGARSVYTVPQGKQKYEKYLAAAGAVCNLILNAILIPVWGINGAAFATLITQIFTNVVMGFFIPAIRENNILILKSLAVWRHFGR